jgi:hypothetical protein
VKVVVAEGSRQPGLSEVLTTTKTPQSRVAEAYAKGYWALLFVSAMWGVVRLQWSFERRGAPKMRPWQWVILTVGVFAFCGAAAWKLSEATGWLVFRGDPR